MAKATPAIHVILTGDDLSRRNVDVEVAFGYVTGFVRLIGAIAEEQRAPLTIAGFDLRGAGVDFEVGVNDVRLAGGCARRAKTLISSPERPPRVLAPLIQDIRDVIADAHTLSYGTMFQAGAKPTRIVLPGEAGKVAFWREIVTRRCVVDRVGGRRPRARFRDVLSGHVFSLSLADEAMARALGKSLYGEVEIRATVRTFGDESLIVDGTVTDMRNVHGGDSLAAWREWFERSGAAQSWDDAVEKHGSLENALASA
jgi:hypothetical protein